MSYVTLAEYKSYIRELTQGQPAGYTSAEDDAMRLFLDQAQRLIEGKTERVFSAKTETRYYLASAVPLAYPDTLLLDYDLLTVTSLVNGNGTTIPADGYWLHPFNESPKWAIVLKSGYSWSFSTDGRVAVTGAWGYMATPNDDVKRVTMQLAWWIQSKRLSLGDVTVLDRGAFTVDGAFPAHIAEWLARHRRKA